MSPEEFAALRRGHEIRSWLRAGVALVVLAGFLLWSFSIFRSDKVADNVKREFSVSLWSAFFYLVMSLPLIIPSAKTLFPTELYSAYCWLPFWYIFVVTTHVGSFVEAAISSFKGGAIAVAYLFLLNCFMPGGAGPLGEDPDFAKRAWFPGGYSLWTTVVLTALVVYTIIVSSAGATTKQYALGLIGQFVVQFMDPNQSSRAFSGVLWNTKQHRIAWDGPVLCQCYILGLAVLLAGLSLPIFPCLPSLRRFYFCHGEAEQGLAALARDTCGSLDQLVMCFREGTTSYTLHSSYLYIRQLGSRRSSVDKLLTFSSYESFSEEMTEAVAYAREVSKLLRGFRQVLRIQLDLLRGCEQALVKIDARDISLMLDEFCVACRDAMAMIMEPGAGTAAGLTYVTDAAAAADRALLSALKLVQADGAGRTTELVFVEGLRSCPMLLRGFAEGCSSGRALRRAESLVQAAGAPSRPIAQAVAETLEQHVFKTSEQHLNALRNLVSWLIALGWSLRVRDHSSACVVAASFLFSNALGSLFDRNTNRMIGVGMGLVISNLPAVLLTSGATHLQYAFQASFPQDFIIYLVAMLLMWTASVYGYLATGAKWSYASCLWAGFGGVQMLTNLQRLEPLWRQELMPDTKRTPPSYQISDTMMDNFTACFICLLVDLIFAKFCHGLTSERVAAVVPECLSDIAKITEGLRTAPLDCDLQPLQQGIALARIWDGEVQKEDLVWSMMWVAPYNGDLVHALLDCCDDAYVAAYAIQVAAERVGDPAEAAAALSAALPLELPERTRLHGRAVRKALRGQLEHVEGELQALEHPCWELSDQALRWARCRGLTLDNKDAAPRLAREASGLSGPSGRRGAGAGEVPPEGAPREAGPAAGPAAGGLEREAALTTLKTQAVALCLAQRRVEALIREHAFWASEDWHATDVLKKLRSMSGELSHEQSSGYSRPLTPRSDRS